MSIKLRWRIAYLLNRLPHTCWANLVSWAQGSRPFIDPDNGDDVRQDSVCRLPTPTGRCYCGKISVPKSGGAA